MAHRLLIAALLLLGAFLAAFALLPKGRQGDLEPTLGSVAPPGTALQPEIAQQPGPARLDLAGAGNAPPPASASRTSLEAYEAPQAELPADGFRPTAVYGRLLDEELQALAGVPLLLFSGEAPLFERTRVLAEGESDETGNYRFEELHATTDYVVYAASEEHRPAWRRHTSGHAEEFRLRRTQTIQGRVFDAASKQPLAEVRVQVETTYWDGKAFQKSFATTSDASGRYRLPWLRVDRNQTLSAIAKDRGPGVFDYRIELGVGDGYDLYLPETVAQTLQLIDAANDGALADTDVRIGGIAHRSDGQGRIAFHWPPSEPSSQLHVEVDGWCRSTLGGSLRDTELLRIPLTRGASLEGMVRDPEGRGIGGAYLLWKKSGPISEWRDPQHSVHFWHSSETVRTASDGSFQITGLAPERDFRIRARHPLYNSAEALRLSLPNIGDHAQVELTLTQGGGVRGTLSLDGEPASAEIQWRSASGRRGRGRSNDGGQYLLANLPLGELSLSVRRDRRASSKEDVVDLVQVQPGITLVHDLVRFTERVAIRGMVLEAGGGPAPGVDVYARGTLAEEQFSTRKKTAADGSFELLVEAKPGLLYRLSAHDGSRAVEQEQVSPGTEGLRLILPEVGQLRLWVRDRFTRQSIDGFRLYYRRHADEPLTLHRQGGSIFSAGPDGSYLAQLPTGTLELWVSASSGGFTDGRLEALRISATTTPEVTLLLEPAVRVRFELEGEERLLRVLERNIERRKLAAYNEVQLLERKKGGPYFNREARPTAFTRDSQGRLEERRLAPGNYRFQGLPKQLRFEPPGFEVLPRDSQTVRIRVVEKRPGKKKNGNGDQGAR